MGKTSEFHIIERSRTELGWLNDESDTLNAPDFDHDFFHSIVASSVAVTVTSHYGVPKVRRASASKRPPATPVPPKPVRDNLDQRIQPAHLARSMRRSSPPRGFSLFDDPAALQEICGRRGCPAVG